MDPWAVLQLIIVVGFFTSPFWLDRVTRAFKGGPDRNGHYVVWGPEGPYCPHCRTGPYDGQG